MGLAEVTYVPHISALSPLAIMMAPGIHNPTRDRIAAHRRTRPRSQRSQPQPFLKGRASVPSQTELTTRPLSVVSPPRRPPSNAV